MISFIFSLIMESWLLRNVGFYRSFLLYFGPRHVSFYRCLQWADCLLHYVQEWAVGRELLQLRVSVLAAGMAGFRCAGAPSYMKITSSSGSRFCLFWAKKSLKRGAFIPPKKAEWNTRPLTGDTARATVTFRPRWPHTCLYARSPNLALPWFLAVQML